MFSGTRSNIHNMICRKHSILVMFYHDYRITQIPQVFQCSKQFIIISLMQTDTWFIQNICHTYQAGANLCCQSDSLRFSSGQRSGCTRQRQIIQSYI